MLIFGSEQTRMGWADETLCNHSKRSRPLLPIESFYTFDAADVRPADRGTMLCNMCTLTNRVLLLAAVFTCLAHAAPPDPAKEKAMKADLVGQVESMKTQAQVMVDTIFSFAELGFQEYETSKYLTD